MKTKLIKMLLIAFAIWMILPSTLYAETSYELTGFIGVEDRTWHPSPQFDYNQWWLALTGVKETKLQWLDAYGKISVGQLKWKRYQESGTLTSGSAVVGLRPHIHLPHSFTPFISLGCGIGIGESLPSKNTLGPNPRGILTYGVGVNKRLSRQIHVTVQYRLWHTSSILYGDTGTNAGGIEAGLGWRW